MRRIVRHRYAKRTLLALMALVFVVEGNNVLDQLRDKYMYLRTRTNVVRVMRGDQRSGGTGFFLTGQSGTNYVITNAHVCAASDDGNHMLVENYSKKLYNGTIIKKDEEKDLCALVLPGLAHGFSIAGGVGVGDTVYATGHPFLLSASPSKGTYLGENIITLYDKPLEDGTCKQGELTQIEIMIFTITVCEIKKTMGYTTLFIWPGNSGSPVFNNHREVVGVIAVGDNRTNYGHMVLTEDLRTFVSDL